MSDINGIKKTLWAAANTLKCNRQVKSIPVTMALAGLTLILCAQRLFHDGYFANSPGDHFIRCAYFLEVFRDTVAEGVWYPRWIPRLYGGYGYPTFLFYQPGFWFFSLPFIWLAYSPVLAFKLSGAAAVFLWVTAIYKIARFFSAAPLVAYATAVGLSLMFPSYESLIDSTTTSQSYAYIFSLWGVYFFLELTAAIATNRRFLGVWGGFIVASTAVLYTHPFVAVFYGLVIASMIIGQCIIYQDSDKRKMLLVSCMGAGIITLALSAPYWFTAWYLSDKVIYDRGMVGFLSPVASFARGEIADKLYNGSLRGYFLFAFRWGIFPVIISYIIYVSRERPVFIAMAVLYVVATFMMRPVSLPVWRAVHYLHYLQYTWRFIYLRGIMDIFFMAKLAGMLSKYVTRSKQAWSLAGILLIACIAFYRPYALERPLGLTLFHKLDNSPSGINYNSKKFFYERHGLETFGTDTFQPRTANTSGLQNRFAGKIPLVEVVGKHPSADMKLTYESTPSGDIHATLEIKELSEASIHLRINQWYFPGWEVMVNEVPLPFQSTVQNVRFDFAANGRIGLEFSEPGIYDIHARYAGPPHWLLRNMAIMLCTGLTLIGFIRYYRGWHERIKLCKSIC